MSKVNFKTIWPKLPSQLTTYYTTWKRQANRRSNLKAFEDDLGELVSWIESIEEESEVTVAEAVAVPVNGILASSLEPGMQAISSSRKRSRSCSTIKDQAAVSATPPICSPRNVGFAGRV